MGTWSFWRDQNDAAALNSEARQTVVSSVSSRRGRHDGDRSKALGFFFQIRFQPLAATFSGSRRGFPGAKTLVTKTNPFFFSLATLP